MKTHENLSLNEPKFILPIVRSLEEGPNYQPNWRWLTVQQYLAEIENPAEADGDSPTKLQLILDREEDEIVRQTLQFQYDVLSDNEAVVKYALLCAASAEDAWMIKAMVVANRSTELVAEEMSTQPAAVDFFEKLYFDVRGYLDKRAWLRKICFGKDRHRWLQVAFERGWPGVEEVILHRLPKGQRGLNPAVSVLLGRVQAGLFQLEASNVDPSEKDLELLWRVLQANTHGQFPFLEDGVEEPPAPESETFKAFKNLPFGSRDKVRFGLDRIMDAMVSKGMAVIAANESKKAQAALETEGPVASQ
jgi:hypothetical protein